MIRYAKVWQACMATTLQLAIAMAIGYSHAGAQPAPARISPLVPRSSLPATDPVSRLSPGDRILVATAEAMFVGRIAALDDTAVTLDQGWTPRAVICRRQITALSVSVPSGSRTTNALGGAMIGASAGALIGMLMGDDEEGFFRITAPQKAAILAVVCAPFGALCGAMKPVERWQEIPLDRLAVTIEPEQRRARIAFACASF